MIKLYKITVYFRFKVLYIYSVGAFAGGGAHGVTAFVFGVEPLRGVTKVYILSFYIFREEREMKKFTKHISVALSLVMAATATFGVIPAVNYKAPAPFAVEAYAAGTSVSWNMGDSAFKSLGKISSSKTVDNLTLVATSSKTMNVKSESATVNGTSFKYCLALGGSGSTSYRAVSANVSGKSTVKITARSSGSSTRNLIIADSKGKKLGSISCGSSAALGTATIDYTGKIYIYSENSGINIYKVQIDSSSSTNVEPTTEATTKAPTTTTTQKQESSASSSKSWNMGDSAFKALSSISSNVTVDGLKLVATSAKTMGVKSENVTVNGTSYKYCLALGGSGSTSYRAAALDVSGKSTIKVTARSSGSSTRTLNVTDSKGNVLGTISCGSSAATGSVTINYSGTVYIYSAGSGINIYKIQLDTTGSLPGGSSVQQTTEKTTEATTKKTTENTTETTTQKPSTPSTGGSVKLSTPPSSVIKTIKSNSESELVAAIKELNSKGGTIYIDTPVINVKSGLKISGTKAGAIVGVQRSDGTYPRIDFSGQSYGTRGITVSGSNQLIQNLIIEKSGDNGIWVSGASNKIEHVITRYNNDSGIQLSDNANGNTLKYCYSYRNCDVKTYGANADGFAPKLGASNTVFEYCFAWDNSDDGWDSYDKSGDKSAKVTYKHSACWNNGNTAVFSGEYDKANSFIYGKKDPNLTLQNSSWISKAEGEMNGNGFKFGSKTTEKSTSVVRTADYCVAFDHKSKGFDNNNSEGCTGYITNCVSFGNNINYQLPYTFAKWSNNWSWSAKKSDQSKQSQSLKKPSNTSNATSAFYAVRNKIVNTVSQNKMPDGVNFDSAINSLG